MHRTNQMRSVWNVKAVEENSLATSRLPKFVQARSAQHRLRRFNVNVTPIGRPTAVVKPNTETKESYGNSINSFDCFKWSGHVDMVNP